MSAIKKDIIIIGQGLAGTLLARLLLKVGKTIHIIDANHRGASTKVAAGIVNPITGRRFVKSWLFSDLYPVAEKMYREIDQETGLEVFQNKKIIRVLTTAEQENEWHSRSAWPEMEPHMDGPPTNFTCQKHFKSVSSLGTTRGGAQVNIGKLIEHYQQEWKNQGILSIQDFNYDELVILSNGIRYREFEADQIIFCEGHAVRNNPWFNHLPFELAKGEVFHLSIPAYQTQHIVKHQVFYAPLNTGLYWVGSNYEKGNPDDSPSKKGKDWLLEKIEKSLDSDFEVVKHEAAIRPTVKDRRPIIGRHSQHAQLVLFNGLGTKGTSLGPYFAKQLLAHLLEDIPLPEEVDIKRYQNKK